MGERIIALAVALGGAALVACAGPSGLREPADPPYVRGPIESISHRATASGLLVRAGPGSREPCGIQATVDADTRFLGRSRAGALRPSALAELEVGDTVEVYVEGPVAESCPVQGYAATVVRVDRRGG